MRRGLIAAIALTSAAWAIAQSTPPPAATTEPPPAWAFVWDSTYVAPPADSTPRTVPGSTVRYSQLDARNRYLSPDWHPGEHPPMPDIVARGRAPEVYACGMCHRAEGTGGPENASVAGLSADYITRQMAEFKSGKRGTVSPPRLAWRLMQAIAVAATDSEVAQSARYFASLRPRKTITVVETDTVPRPLIAGHFFVPSPEGGREALGRRIIEMPEDVERFELRDSRATFVAYVPPGSVARGEQLAKTGGDGVTVQCTLCHGKDMRGALQAPSIAGRSPTYIVRQLYDFKAGARAGTGSVLMQATVRRLAVKDMIALASYLATLEP